MNRGPLLLLAAAGVACGLSLTQAQLLDDVQDGGTSSGNLPRGDSGRGEGGLVEGDASADGAPSVPDASIPPMGDADICNGRPLPNYPTDSTCYWVSGAADTLTSQADICEDGGRPFAPKGAGDLFIPPTLSKNTASGIEALWVEAKYAGAGSDNVGLSFTPWKWPSDGFFPRPIYVDHQRNENCLTARYQNIAEGYDSVGCNGTKHRVVCQSK
jgi:hypothetical protein